MKLFDQSHQACLTKHGSLQRDNRKLNCQTFFSRRGAEPQRGPSYCFQTETGSCTRGMPNLFLPLALFLPFSAPLRLCARLVLLLQGVSET